jgi:choloylglycine hydrolase
MRGLGVSLLFASSLGCSYVHVPTPKDGMIIGRTMELGGSPLTDGLTLAARALLQPHPGADHPLNWVVATHRRGETQGEGATVVCPGVASWKATYGYVSVDVTTNVSGVNTGQMATDGVNEKGLTVSGHTLRQSEYQAPGHDKASNVCWLMFVGWALANFDSVNSLRATLTSTHVVGASRPMPDSAGVHWAVDDSTGASIVVEVVGGVLSVHNNSVGTFTNDPDFRWHLRNLNNYAFLSPDWTAQHPAVTVQSEVGVLPQAIGHGLNLRGIPGDISPPSRFVRLFYLRQYAMLKSPPTSLNESLAIATGLLNGVFIVKGTVSEPDPQSELFEFTQYALLKLPAKRQLYYRDYMNGQWHRICLDELDFSAAAGGKVDPTLELADGTAGIVDVTRRLQH